MSSSTPDLPHGEPHPLRSAMKHDDDSERAADSGSSIKAVQIAEPEPEPSSPEDSQPRKQFSAGLSRRLSGRPAVLPTNSSRASLLNQTSVEALANLQSRDLPQPPGDESSQIQQHHHHHRHRLDRMGERLVAQVAEWIEHEKAKKSHRKLKHVTSSRRRSNAHDAQETEAEPGSSRSRRYSVDSQSSEVSLDRLQKIIDDSMTSLGLSGVPHYSPRPGRKSQRKRSLHLHRTASSDTDFFDGDILVPKCDAVLDNSKTMSYSGGNAGGDEDTASISKRKEDKERQAWLIFKNEIIRLAHTLRLKGWRRIPLDSGDSIAVERLSGAMTNAVYVVHPPDNIENEMGKKMPLKLLLRVYGPQVEHIIDRENELNVLRRLARKKIGPRLLGTFANGRFEQFLNAITLTNADLRDPDTSKQIAKRMRELHDGIELLEEERDGGANVLKNWDSWLDKVSEAASFLDDKIVAGKRQLGHTRTALDTWMDHGFVCGTDWKTFSAMVMKYRKYIFERYGGSKVVRDHLVFAHSDTQYGNILRLRPDDKRSPLLQPNYEHKQLVVIDFEYAAANVRGLEFANHFTEWCYDYHAEDNPGTCKISMYPNLEEQHRFMKAYVVHKPEFPHPGASTPVLTPLATPTIGPSTPSLNPAMAASTSSLKEFMLDARVPTGGWKEEEKRQEEQVEDQIQALIEETRLWRTVNSAQWVAWGIMQANIPGFVPSGEADDAADRSSEEAQEDPDAFDYLGYAQDRAMFFWGDCVRVGLVKVEDLPEKIRNILKITEY
ncbi:kinase-like protein [Xylariaceae sp. FL1019]|nr:kinase-like protein [Xylariaceae sp. FL1019]